MDDIANDCNAVLKLWSENLGLCMCIFVKSCSLDSVLTYEYKTTISGSANVDGSNHYVQGEGRHLLNQT